MATDLSSMHVRMFLSEEGEALATAELSDLRYGLYPDTPWESWRYRYIKRAIDLAGASTLLLSCAVPCVTIALAVKLTSKGPIFYREERIGQNGQRFRIWKFRSMRVRSTQPVAASVRQADDAEQWRMKKGQKDCVDPRITPIGGFLRKWSLDELPQLLNVFRGDMSLVGPRPIVQKETEAYGELFAYYLAAKPGLSGLWQVSGRSNLDYDKRAKLDAFYVQTWSLATDFYLLARTVSAVLSRSGAY